MLSSCCVVVLFGFYCSTFVIATAILVQVKICIAEKADNRWTVVPSAWSSKWQHFNRAHFPLYTPRQAIIFTFRNCDGKKKANKFYSVDHCWQIIIASTAICASRISQALYCKVQKVSIVVQLYFSCLCNSIYTVVVCSIPTVTSALFTVFA